MSIDGAVIAYVAKYDDILSIQQAGIELDHFVDEWRQMWRYVLRSKREHDAVPSLDTLQARFPDSEFPRVRKTELPIYVSDIKKRRRYIRFLEALNAAANSATDMETVNDVISSLQGDLSSIGYSEGQRSHLVDLFTPSTAQRIRQDMRDINSPQSAAIPTGFKRFDTIAGGLHKGRMVTIIGRSGLGKSWIDLYFAAHAVSAGATVMLYPLEMTLFETATRLYTIFTQMHFGHEKVLKNFDLTSGKISWNKIARFLAALEDKFAGQLYVADVSSLADPYTVERIEAEVEAHRPQMFWVDYITLLKGNSRLEGHELVRQLSNGVKTIAMRQNVVGGASAQVNREAIRSVGGRPAFLPRLEHISYGDSIGQDSDQVFSINRKGDDLYYALVKNRHGPEIGKTRVRFQVNEGILQESDDQEDDDD